MKTKVRIALVALLGITLLICGLPMSSAAPHSPNHQDKERVHSKRGPEVGKRVRELQKHNKDVRSALAVFERNAARNGHSPRLDDAFSVTRDPAGGTAGLKDALTPATTPFRKVGFKPQDTDYSAYGLEIIVIPTYYVPGQWQGTIIFNKFDPSGSYLGEYVADVVITLDSTQTFMDVTFEVSFEGDNAYLECGDPSVYGDLGDPGAGGGFNPPPISSLASARIFKKAAFTPQLNPFRLGQRIGGANPRVRQYVRCTWGGSGAAALGCGVGALVFGPAILPECGLIGVATANAGCGIYAIFRL